MFCKKGALRNFAKFTGKHLRQRLFFNKVKKESLAQVFSCEFCKISKNNFFYRTPPVAASILHIVRNATEGIIETNLTLTTQPMRKI